VTKLSIDTVRFRARFKYVKWVPFLGTIFLFSYQIGLTLIPWHLIEIPNGELAAQQTISIQQLLYL
jgi:hypothetical protein